MKIELLRYSRLNIEEDQGKNQFDTILACPTIPLQLGVIMGAKNTKKSTIDYDRYNDNTSGFIRTWILLGPLPMS